MSSQQQQLLSNDHFHQRTTSTNSTYSTTSTLNNETQHRQRNSIILSPISSSSCTSSSQVTVGGSMEHRMTELFVLAGGGTKPFWRNTTTSTTTNMNDNNNSTNTNTKTTLHDHPIHNGVNNDTNDVITQLFHSKKSLSIYQTIRIIFYCWMISISCMVLLYPSYKSTDFDVHRHWKSLTYHIVPIHHWYNNNTNQIYVTNPILDITTTTTTTTNTKKYKKLYVNYKTVVTQHTLDYPPLFALFEYSMVHNYIVTNILFPKFSYNNSTSIKYGSISNYEDHYDRCLDIMDDSTIYNRNTPNTIISKRCISYMRTTVLLFADGIYWIGSLIISIALPVVTTVTTTTTVRHINHHTSKIVPYSLSKVSIATFVLLVFHPTLMYLDHIHFQYNGTMLGVLLLSISCLLFANNHYYYYDSNLPSKNVFSEHRYHLLSITLFCILITLKHLYVTCILWYVVYIFRRYCIVPTATCASATLESNSRPSNTFVTFTRQNQFRIIRLLGVALVSSCTILLPFVPFLISIYYDKTTSAHNIRYSDRLHVWFIQLFHRLFPFQRGLVHTYWAGNVWAIYVAIYKIGSYMIRITGVPNSTIQQLWNILIPSPESITPKTSAICMLLAQLPGLYIAWIAASERSNIKLLQSFTIISLGTFLFQYHAHEKAIITSLLPCLVWYTALRIVHDHNNNNVVFSSTVIQRAGSILFDMNAYSILGIYPLLYQSQELLVKVSSTILYLSCIALWCKHSKNKNNSNTNKHNFSNVSTTTNMDHWFTTVVVSLTVIQLEIPYSWFWGKYEFMPLATTSIVCAFGYISIYIRLLYI